MYNYQDILQEVSKEQATYGDYQEAKATLHLFSPKVLPAQVLRPYVYNFTPKFVDDVMSITGGSLQAAVAPMGAGIISDSVNQAILPDVNGVLLDTYTINNQWSFVLILDDSPINRGMRNAMPGPTVRMVCTGYTNTEPINPLTGTLNPNAVLIFTNTAVTYLTSDVGQFGTQRKYQCSTNSDFVGELNAQLSNEPLFIGTPGDIAANVTTVMGENGEPEVIGDYGSMALSNEKVDTPSRSVSTTLSSPKHQLGAIMASVDGAINSVDNHDWLRSSIIAETPDNHYDVAKNYFKQNAPGSNNSLPKIGLDTSRPLTISEVEFHYGVINVGLHRVPNESTWGVSPQDTQTVRNQMSSMIAASISSYLPGCCLSDIAFRYCSWTRADMFSTVNNGVWQIMQYHNLINVTPQEEKSNIQTFQSVCETQLFPILKSVHGEFDLMVYCNSAGEIVVDLLYLDDRNQLNPGEGFYETNSRLGGLTNPMVAGFDNINHNVTQLHGITDILIGKKLGPGQFNAAPVNMQPVGVPNVSPSPYSNIF